MKYGICHLTTTKYASTVRLAQIKLRLRPVEWPRQTISDYQLAIDPPPQSLMETEGAYPVHETKFTLREPISQLQVESRFTAEIQPLPFLVSETPSPAIADLREMALTHPDLSPVSPASYLFASPMAAPERDIALWASGFLNDSMPVLQAGSALMSAIHEQFTFDSVATVIDTPAIEAFNKRSGVCQDFAHIMIIAARSRGIPAAYMSGYLRTLPPPGQDRLVGADAMHAWVGVWCGPELGWIGCDPTNNVFAETDHILIAMGRDYGDVAPLDGVVHGSANQSMFFSVDVAPRD